MAFETISGASGVDFIGTENVDVLFSLNEAGRQSVVAAGGDDDITLENFTGVVGTATVRGGEGDDTITVGTGESGITRIADSSVNGGAGDDTITTDLIYAGG